MTPLVPSSASAQAVETDFDGLNVRSKPATGVCLVPLGGVAPSGSPVIGSAQAPSMLTRCSSVTCDHFSTPLPSSKSAKPDPRKTPGGVQIGRASCREKE